MRTLIAIPCMDMVHTVFFQSMLGLNKVGEVRYCVSCSSLIYDARNGLAKKALDENFDRVLWLDSDMEFEPDMMQKLSADLDEGKEFVCGLYFKRKAPIKPVIYKECGYYHSEERDEVTPLAVSYEDYPRDSLFEVAAAGFGAVYMTTSLLKRVVDKFGMPFSPILGFGEDLSFCTRARQIGAALWCDSRVKLGHVGQGTISETTYLGVKHDA